MENNDLPTTSQLVQMLLDSFAKNDGRENFGYIVATYEKVGDKVLFSSGISTATGEQTTNLVDTLTDMFQQIKDEDQTDQERDDENLGLN